MKYEDFVNVSWLPCSALASSVWAKSDPISGSFRAVFVYILCGFGFTSRISCLPFVLVHENSINLWGLDKTFYILDPFLDLSI